MLHIYISPTGRNYAVSYWRKIFHIKLSTRRNYAVSYWRKIFHINTTDCKKLLYIYSRQRYDTIFGNRSDKIGQARV